MHEHARSLQVECKSPSHYAVGAASDRIQCTAFDSFKKIPRLHGVMLQVEIESSVALS